MMHLPSYDSQFITLFESTEGYVRRHIAVDVHASDYAYLEEIAFEKANLGKMVDIMPILQDGDPLRSVFFADAFGFKCPDLRIDGVLWEVERSYNSQSLNNLKHAVDEGRKQADFIIIDLSCDISLQFMHRIIVGRFKDHKNLKIIEFRFEGKYHTFYK